MKRQTPSVAMYLPNADRGYPYRLASSLDIPIVTGRKGDFDMVLSWEEGELKLVDLRDSGLKPLGVDFLTKWQNTKSLPIARRGSFAQALGRGTETVIDATAGWGRDATLIWLMGYRLLAIERSTIVGALLLDGLHRLKLRATGVLPEIVVADAREYLLKRSADCVYLDPMFPPKRKRSALSRRSLTVLRELAGDDEDFEFLFEIAIKAANKRVVIKRPSHSLPLVASPTHTFVGNLIDYDVYLVK